MKRRKKQLPAARPAPPANIEARDAAVRRVYDVFRVAIPSPAASRGHYQAPDGGENNLPVPNGTYRVTGADWLLSFKGGRFVEAQLVRPPHFGGKDVIAIPATANG